MRPHAEWLPLDNDGEFWVYGIPGTTVDFAAIYQTGYLDENLDWVVEWKAMRRGPGTTNVTEKFVTMWAAAQWCLE